MTEVLIVAIACVNLENTVAWFLLHDHIYPLWLKVATIFREGWNYYDAHYISYFTHCCDKDPIKATQKRCDLGSELRGKAHQGGESMVVSAALAAVARTQGRWSHCSCSQEADINACCAQMASSLSYSVQHHKMVLTTVGGGVLPPS